MTDETTAVDLLGSQEAGHRLEAARAARQLLTAAFNTASAGDVIALADWLMTGRASIERLPVDTWAEIYDFDPRCIETLDYCQQEWGALGTLRAARAAWPQAFDALLAADPHIIVSTAEPESDPHPEDQAMLVRCPGCNTGGITLHAAGCPNAGERERKFYGRGVDA